MKENNKATTRKKSNIQCMEVLISKDFMANSGHNLFWTLSVYSLQNEPVKKNRALNDCEIFHFMVYDWERTIQQLLDELQVPYSVVQYFNTEDICAFNTEEMPALKDDEEQLLTAVSSISQFQHSNKVHTASKDKQQVADLMLEQ